jgi:hypothetical protein
MKIHIDDIKVLIFIQNTLGIGKVYKSKTSCRLIISKQSDIKKVIGILTNYSLNSNKILNSVLEWKLLIYILIERVIQPRIFLIR